MDSNTDATVVVRSTDDFASVGTPVTLSQYPRALDSREPRIVSGGSGTWVALWAAREDPNDFFAESDIMFSRSTDDGMSWSSASALNSNASTDNDDPRFASHGAHVLPPIGADPTGAQSTRLPGPRDAAGQEILDASDSPSRVNSSSSIH